MRPTPRTPNFSKRSSVLGIALSAILAAFAHADAPRAETIGGALVKAYLSNPDIGQQRAAVRVADENVPKAASGYRPRADAEADSALLDPKKTYNLPVGQAAVAAKAITYAFGTPTPMLAKARGFSVKADEDLWDANRTANSIRRADSRVMAAREQLRNTEQNVLLDGVGAYMDVMRDTAVLALYRAHVHVLEETLREAKDRFGAGEVTQTGVAQVEARLAGARANALSAQSLLQTSLAEYRRVIGEQPNRLDPARPLNQPLPATLAEAIAISQREHPAILASQYGVDAASLEIDVAESHLYPTVTAEGLIERRFNAASDLTPTVPFRASTTVTMNAPVYDGGKTFAIVRQDKEELDQKELQTDLEREKVRAAVVAVWGRNENARGLIDAAMKQVAAAEEVVAGVREEARLGQRTTLDELNAEQLLLRARIQLVFAQRDQVVTSYALLSAVGRLSTATLALAVTPYDPAVHLGQVKDKWIGLRTPDGR